MKRTMRLFLAAMLSVWTIPAAAQHMDKHHEGKEMPMQMSRSGDMKCMMHGGTMQSMHGMMGQMMNDPLMHSRMLIGVLPTMKEPLSLSDEQVAGLSQIKADYESRRSELTDRLRKANDRVQDVLASEAPDISQLKEALKEAATLQADLEGTAFEAAMTMKSQLSPEQRAHLDGMPPMKMHQFMMANMTMMEMMQAMHGDEMMGGMMMGHDREAMPKEMKMMKDAMPKKMEMMKSEGMVKPDENKK